jgi:NAD(P)-dependent dehydrogenase (short-subunit alcohol dehydrogenase family)
VQKPIDLRSDGRLAGRVAVVAGGGATGSDPELPGTGEATAILFASEGASVVVIGRSVDHTNSQSSELGPWAARRSVCWGTSPPRLTVSA